MLYRNKKTGVTVETVSKCGGDWEPVEKAKKEPKEKKEKKEKREKK